MFAGDPLQRKLVLLCPWMAAMHNHDEVLGEQWLDSEFGVVHWQMHNGGIEVPGHQAGEQGCGASLEHGHVHQWMLLGERREQLRHQPPRRGANDSNASVTAHGVATAGHIGRDVVHLAQDAPGTFDNLTAVVGEATAVAVDQRDAEFFFEPGDMPRNVGLHGVERPSRRRKRPVIGDCHEC